MTPAEHFAEAERILIEVGKTAEEFHSKLPDGTDLLDPLVIKAAELTATSLAMGVAEAQVHATLATVPAMSACVCTSRLSMGGPTIDIVEGCPIHAGMEIRSTPDPGCICPHLDAEPLARLATFPACPVHGDPG